MRPLDRERTFYGFAKVHDQMEAIRYLNGLRRSATCSFGIGPLAIACQHADTWVLLQPGGERFCRPRR